MFERNGSNGVRKWQTDLNLLNILLFFRKRVANVNQSVMENKCSPSMGEKRRNHRRTIRMGFQLNYSFESKYCFDEIIFAKIEMSVSSVQFSINLQQMAQMEK